MLYAITQGPSAQSHSTLWVRADGKWLMLPEPGSDIIGFVAVDRVRAEQAAEYLESQSDTPAEIHTVH